MTVEDFLFHMRIWGWTVDGVDESAMVAEGYPVDGWWDRTAADLEHSLVSHAGEPYQRVPDWWALACAPDIAFERLVTAS